MTINDAELQQLRTAGELDGERRALQLYIAGWIALLADELPLTPPHETVLFRSAAGDWQPHVGIRTAAGDEFDVRVLAAPSAADLTQTWKDGLHAPSRSTCPGCEAELMRVGLPSIAYTYETCWCGIPDYDHLVEQLWHRSCLAKAEPATVAE